MNSKLLQISGEILNKLTVDEQMLKAGLCLVKGWAVCKAGGYYTDYGIF